MTPIAVPAFADNYIWLAADHGQLAIVDPGTAEPVLAALRALKREPTAIVITHHHPDHIGGLDALLARWPTLPVYGPADEPRVPRLTHPVRDGETITTGLPGAWTVLAVPGHTRSHVAYHDAAHAVLYCGDTLFSLGCGRLFEGSPQQMLASLQRLAGLPADTRVCCAHEYTLANLRFARSLLPDDTALAALGAELAALRAQGQPTLPSTIARERAFNPFLRSEEPQLRARIIAAAGLPEDSTAVTVFAALRALKDRA